MLKLDLHKVAYPVWLVMLVVIFAMSLSLLNIFLYDRFLFLDLETIKLVLFALSFVSILGFINFAVMAPTGFIYIEEDEDLVMSILIITAFACITLALTAITLAICMLFSFPMYIGLIVGTTAQIIIIGVVLKVKDSMYIK